MITAHLRALAKEWSAARRWSAPSDIARQLADAVLALDTADDKLNLLLHDLADDVRKGQYLNALAIAARIQLDLVTRFGRALRDPPPATPTKNLWTAYGVTHEIVDDEDDHRILVARCGDRLYYLPSNHRGPQGAEVDCPACLRQEQ